MSFWRSFRETAFGITYSAGGTQVYLLNFAPLMWMWFDQSTPQFTWVAFGPFRFMGPLSLTYVPEEQIGPPKTRVSRRLAKGQT